MVNVKRIPIDKLSVGMVLGDDVINSNGLILIPRNTTIQQKHIFRLKLYDILSVVVEDRIDNVVNEEPSQDVVLQLDSSQQAFNEFRNIYVEKEVEVKNQLYAISNGEPVHIDELLKISHTLLNGLKTKSSLFNYLYNLRATDDYTYTHSINVSLLCNIFGNWLKMSPEQVEELTTAGLLHDIGKIKVDQNILNKPGKLTPHEFEKIKKHSQFGYEILKDQNISENVKYGVLMHHEKINGTGYPLGLFDADIHDYGKIIAIVDIYDAMTSNRSYHTKFSPFKVIQIFEQDSFGLLDTAFLFVFLENIAHNYLGKSVKLSTGQEGKIIFIHNNAPSRPIIEIGDQMLDLIDLPAITIDEIL